MALWKKNHNLFTGRILTHCIKKFISYRSTLTTVSSGDWLVKLMNTWYVKTFRMLRLTLLFPDNYLAVSFRPSIFQIRINYELVLQSTHAGSPGYKKELSLKRLEKMIFPTTVGLPIRAAKFGKLNFFFYSMLIVRWIWKHNSGGKIFNADDNGPWH